MVCGEAPPDARADDDDVGRRTVRLNGRTAIRRDERRGLPTRVGAAEEEKPGACASGLEEVASLERVGWLGRVRLRSVAHIGATGWGTRGTWLATGQTSNCDLVLARALPRARWWVARRFAPSSQAAS